MVQELDKISVNRGPPSGLVNTSLASGWRQAERPKWYQRYFGSLVFVALPTLMATVYYAFIAAPIFLCTAQFVVKDAGQAQPTPGLGQMLQSVGLTPSPIDAYTVDAYITSRDALVELAKTLPIRAIYDRPESDFITRFPNFYTFFRKSFEYLYWHYLNWVVIDFDSTTAITTVSAYAFRADDARNIAAKLLDLSESTVNDINNRARVDGLRAMKDEVVDLQKRSASIQQEITAYRNSAAILDPNQASNSAMSLAATLQSDLVSDAALLYQLKSTAPNSPQIPGLESRIKSVQAQILDQTRQNAGGAASLANKMAPYTALLLKQQFAQQMLQAAVSSLESAEVSVQLKRLYLVRIAEPHLPDWPEYPYRVLDTFIVFLTSLVGYTILRIMVSVLGEHAF